MVLQGLMRGKRNQFGTTLLAISALAIFSLMTFGNRQQMEPKSVGMKQDSSLEPDAGDCPDLAEATKLYIRPNDDDDCPPRNIFIDAGANMANSMRFFDHAKGNFHKGTPWEVYSFEACPLLAFMTQLAADEENGVDKHPEIHFSSIPGLQDCINRYYKDEVKYSECHQGLMKFQQQLLESTSSRGSYENVKEEAEGDSQHAVKRMLQDAKCMHALPERTGFRVFPVAVGSCPGRVSMDWKSQHYLNGGSNVKGMRLHDDSQKSEAMHFNVGQVDIVDWIKRSFRPQDFVYLKLDIEGSEYEVMRRLVSTGVISLIDEAEIEWHSRLGQGKFGEATDRMFEWILKDTNTVFHFHG